MRGRTDLGVAWAVMPNAKPADRISVRLRFASGSLLETEAQRGLAHYLEHMAFNGSTNFPAGSLVETLQRFGMAFGADTNAHTGFSETVYKLDLPDAAPATLALGLRVLADQGFALTLAPEEVERERGIILAEMRDRDDAGRRAWQAQAEASYAGTILPARMPIGTQATVSAATRDQLAAYYRTWYRPERALVIVVGAVQPAAVEAAINEAFAVGAFAEAAVAEPSLGTLQPGEVSAWRHDAEASGTQVVIQRTRSEDPGPDRAERRERELYRDLAERVLSRRLDRLREQDPQGPLLSSGAWSYHRWGIAHAGVTGMAKPGRVSAAAALLESERRRMIEHGPTANELSSVIAAQHAELDAAIAQAAIRTNAFLADALAAAADEDRRFLAPKQERDLVSPWLGAATPAACREAYAAAWAGPGRLVCLVDGREQESASDGAANLAVVWAGARTAAVDPPVERAAVAWPYAPGTPVEPVAVTDAAHGIRQFVWANHVCANLAPSDRAPGVVLVQARLLLPAALPPWAVWGFAILSLGSSGTAHLNADDLRLALSSTSVKGRELTLTDRSLTVTVSCAPDDLATAVQIVLARITDPAWRHDPTEGERIRWLETLDALPSDPAALADNALEDLFAAGDPARTPATRKQAAAVTLAESRAWLEPHLASAPLALSVVGQAPADTAALLAAHLGSLPAREPWPLQADLVSGLVPVAPAPVGERRDLLAQGTTPVAALRLTWPTTDHRDVRVVRRLSFLAAAFDDRLREELRERLGEAYSPVAWNASSDTWAGVGRLTVEASVAPAKAAEAEAAIRAVASELHQRGVSADLLARIAAPRIKNVEAMRQGNAYWLTVVDRSHWQPFRLAWATSLPDDLAGITTEDLAALARTYLDPARAIAVVAITPEP